MDFVRKWIAGREMKRARALEGEGYWDPAFRAYEAALPQAAGQDRLPALLGIGRTGFRLDKLARAREALAEAVALAPADPDARLLLGRVCFELRDLTGADEAYHEALKLAPGRVDVLHAQAELYAVKFPRAGFEAGKRVVAAMRERPGEAERVGFPRELPLVFLRNLAADQRFVDETVAYFDELVAARDWIRPVALNHRGILLANTGKLDEAVKAYLDALSADPEFDAAHVNLALVHARRRDFDAAKTSMSVYAKKHPTDAIATYGFGVIAENRPDVEEMIRLYAFFLDRMKTTPPPSLQLGRLDVARGWVQHVATVLEHARKHRAEQHDPTTADDDGVEGA